jgi:hypothetical protein
VQYDGKLTQKYGGSKLGEETSTFLWKLSKFLLPDCTLAHPIREYSDSVLIGCCAVSLDFQTFRNIVIVQGVSFCTP